MQSKSLKSHMLKSSVLGLSTLLLLTACGPQNTPAEAQSSEPAMADDMMAPTMAKVDALNGRWESFSCELRPQAGPDGVTDWYLKRVVSFGPNRIDAHFTTYADKGCNTPLVELKFGGTTEFINASETVPGAMNVNLYVDDYLTITPQQEGFAGFLNSAETGSCGGETWTVGQEQNIYQTGCSVMGVAPATPTTEYETLYVAGNKLYFGARPVNGVALSSESDRPAALQIPLRLVSGGPTQQVGDGDAREPGVVELVIAKQKPGASIADIEAMFHGYTTQMNKFDTLLYRTVGHDGNGNWTCVNYWPSEADMKTLNKDAQTWASMSQFGELMDLSSVSIITYDISSPN